MRQHSNSGLNLQGKIIVLWATFLLGMLFHTQLALMPLFHGIDVTQSHTHEYLELSSILWLMLAFFSLPMLAMIATAFTASQRYRRLHLGLTLFFTVCNLLHFVADVLVTVPSYQLFLMSFLFGIGLFLNLVSYQWVKEENRYRSVSSSIG